MRAQVIFLDLQAVLHPLRLREAGLGAAVDITASQFLRKLCEKTGSKLVGLNFTLQPTDPEVLALAPYWHEKSFAEAHLEHPGVAIDLWLHAHGRRREFCVVTCDFSHLMAYQKARCVQVNYNDGLLWLQMLLLKKLCNCA